MRNFIPFLSLVIFSLLFRVCCEGQSADSSKLILAEIVSFHSGILGEDRKLQIYTPDLGNFEKFEGQSLPVLYLLDGDALTGVVASQVNYLSNNYFILPPMIIVGISNYDYNRLHDLTPSSPPHGFNGDSSANAFGGAEKFAQFIENELFPFIDHRYKTDSFRILAGHSLGGLFSFYCLTQHPHLFNACIAISPSLWWDNRYTMRQAISSLPNGFVQPRFFFYSDGNEGGEFHNAVTSLDSSLNKRNLKNLTAKYTCYPDESHGSEPVKAIYDALKFIFPGWYPAITDSTATLVQQHFERLSKLYGYRIIVPEWFAERRGTRILNAGLIDDAIGFFELNVTNYPQSGSAQLKLASAYEKKADLKKALKHYKIAAGLLPKDKMIEEKLEELKQAAKKL